MRGHNLSETVLMVLMRGHNLSETVLMRCHNKYFYGEIVETLLELSSNTCLTWASKFNP